ncbi:MAG TPA: signal peptidase I [Cryptosporangiaceae bacterium]|nr:signal peptidase I [Cryptosporangiaceae bacterium]
MWQELPLLLLVAFSLALIIKTFIVQAFFIPSGSMENTLAIHDRVLVNKVVYVFREPRRGEVIVFRGTDSWAPEVAPSGNTGVVAGAARWIGNLIGFGEPDEKDFVKRVIGVGGDTVQCCDAQGRVEVNGQPLDEPNVFDNNPVDTRGFGPIQVPQGRLFVMGDHRGNSQDSRHYIRDQWRGTVAVDDVIGQAFLTVWPIGHWRSLPVPETYQTVPGPIALGAPPAATPDPAGEPALVLLVPTVLGPIAPAAVRRPRRLRG